MQLCILHWLNLFGWKSWDHNPYLQQNTNVILLIAEKGVEVSAPVMNLSAEKVHSVLENLVQKKWNIALHV